MRIYVASSWRNTLQPSVVAALREAGHDVYDFRNPVPGDHGFSWKQCLHADVEYTPILDPRLFRDEVLAHPVAQAAFAKDMGALRNADATVLVLPCGRSAHLELGWAAGAGQRTVVLLDDPLSEPELMYLACTKLCVSVGEVLEALQEPTVCNDESGCDHGIAFDSVAARGLSAHEVRKHWPRLFGPCPKGCGFDGIGYASFEHYVAGDW